MTKAGARRRRALLVTRGTGFLGSYLSERLLYMKESDSRELHGEDIQ